MLPTATILEGEFLWMMTILSRKNADDPKRRNWKNEFNILDSVIRKQ